MGEGDAIKEIEKKKAEGRMLEGKELDDPEQNFAQGRNPQSRDKIAERIKIGSNHFLWYIYIQIVIFNYLVEVID